MVRERVRQLLAQHGVGEAKVLVSLMSAGLVASPSGWSEDGAAEAEKVLRGRRTDDSCHGWWLGRSEHRASVAVAVLPLRR